jgi:hypothetical protein
MAAISCSTLVSPRQGIGFRSTKSVVRLLHAEDGIPVPNETAGVAGIATPAAIRRSI